MVGEAGLEPAHPFEYRHLKPARLPISPLALRLCNISATSGSIDFPLRSGLTTITVEVVMVLKSVENRLERIFERTFSRPFKSALQPIEIGTRIIREVDLTRRLSGQGPISANQIRVWLGPADAVRFEGFQKALVTELEETVRQHAVSEGYSFVGPVQVEIFIDDDVKAGDLEVKAEFIGGESQPRLIMSDGRSFNVGDRALVIGRSPEIDVVINDSNVSRRHAEVWRTSEGVAIRDLQSTNGTFVNGHRVTAVSLSPRDDITISTLHMRIELA